MCSMYCNCHMLQPAVTAVLCKCGVGSPALQRSRRSRAAAARGRPSVRFPDHLGPLLSASCSLPPTPARCADETGRANVRQTAAVRGCAYRWPATERQRHAACNDCGARRAPVCILARIAPACTVLDCHPPCGTWRVALYPDHRPLPQHAAGDRTVCTCIHINQAWEMRVTD